MNTFAKLSPFLASGIIALMIHTGALQCSWWWVLAPFIIIAAFSFMLLLAIWYFNEKHGGMHW